MNSISKAAVKNGFARLRRQHEQHITIRALQKHIESLLDDPLFQDEAELLNDLEAAIVSERNTSKEQAKPTEHIRAVMKNFEDWVDATGVVTKNSSWYFEMQCMLENAASAKPQQEPIATEAIYQTIIQWDEGGGKRSRRELARRIVAIYALPQAPKPMSDDADGVALRLAVALCIDIEHNMPGDHAAYVVASRRGCEMMFDPVSIVEDVDGNRAIATRRAIMRAADEITSKSRDPSKLYPDDAKPQEPIYWDVIYNGNHVGNVHSSKVEAESAMHLLNAKHKGEREVVALYLHPQAEKVQDFDKLAKLGWQAIECSLCGSSAMAFPVAQVREPMSEEQDRALCEAHCNTTSDAYFEARPQLDDNATNRRIFYAGHRKAWLEKDATVEASCKEIK